jgi:hypothetical protein
MNWLIFVGALELAWFPLSATHQYRVPDYQEAADFSMDLGVTMEGEARISIGRIGYLYAGGALNVLLEWGPDRWPTTLYSVTTGGLRLGVLDVGLRWICAHPIYPWTLPPPVLWESTIVKVFVRISNER